MRIIGLPLLSDNYSWILCPEDSGPCAVVDPSEAGPVLDVLKGESRHLGWILATHHHHDHVGGVSGLAAGFDGVEIACSAVDARRVPEVNHVVEDGERLRVAGSPAVAIFVPGHTLGAIAWHFPDENALFSGDTLFGAGCGRLFEGDAAQLFSSLCRLRDLPGETRVFCGHEYTVKNLRFALEVEPENEEVRKRLDAALARTSRGEPTVPFTLEDESLTNPFLRADEPALMRLVGTTDPISTFAELRRRRDSY